MQENVFDSLMYHAGLTAQGSMDHMDAYDRAAIEKYGQLIVQECAELFKLTYTDEQYARRIDKTILKHFNMYAE
jgi:hypothetical protein